MGSSPCKRIHLLGIAHLVVGKYFQVLEVHWGGGCITSKSLVVKKAGLWPIHIFCNILGRISSFVLVNEKFCSKNLFLDLLSLVLIEFLVFTTCRSCIKVVVVHEMHWKRV